MVKLVSREQAFASIGVEAPPTEWMKVDQQMITNFADVTLDHQFIHIDPEKAKQTPFGGTIAHGFLTLSLVSHFAEEFGLVIDGAVMAVNYGFDKVRFINPVKSGSEIRARSRAVGITEKKTGHFMVKYDVTIEVKDEEKPALIAEWLIMLMVE